MINKINSLYQKITVSVDNISWKVKFQVLFALFLILSCIFIGWRYLSPENALQVGKPSPNTIISPQNIRIVDEVATQELKKKARSEVKTIYTLDPAVEAASQKKLDRLFEVIDKGRASESLPAEVLEKVKKLGFQNLTTGDIEYLLKLEKTSYQDFKATLSSTARTLFAIRIKPDEKKIALLKAKDILSASGYTNGEIELAGRILENILSPNYLPDMAKTEEARREAEKKVSEVIIQKQKGEVVVREGEIITREDAMVLKRLGYGRVGPDYLRFFISSLLVTFVFFMLYFFLEIFFAGDKNFYRKAAFVFTVIFIYNLLARSFIGTQYQFLIPLSFVCVATMSFFKPELAGGTLLASLLLTFLYPETSVILVVAVGLPAIFTLYLFNRVEQQSHIIRGGFFLALLTTGLTALIAFLFRYDLQSGLKMVLETASGSFLAVVLALGLMPFFEAVFHTTSPLRLMELASPSHPLLRELMQKAPGTYNHSVMTANLAEAAAHAIGANPLLVRVGSYYHDIGKIKRPIFFVENQVGMKNPHDETNPSLSRLIISSHVKDGVELARKHRLPEEIIDIIAEHHGTTLMYPIYKKALEESNGEVPEDAFRYNFARPKTKEAAIVMLADSVEAASRTISKKTPEKLEKVIRAIIKERLEDGQLDEAPLTLSDLQKIGEAFVNVLSGLYHERLDYPEYSELKKAEPNGSGSTKLKEG
jgi:putative nucleotidyltransferase with HDIG domain